tara:strand:- start:48 stop:368 length:321 start_codon:yes stop_codon:yes gene_type:complete
MSNEFNTAFDKWVQRRKSTPKKKYHLKFGTQEVEVTLDRYIEVTRHGIHHYELKDNKIVLKPFRKTLQPKPVLAPAQLMGYHFQNGDPYWVTKHDKGGFEWVTGQE